MESVKDFHKIFIKLKLNLIANDTVIAGWNSHLHNISQKREKIKMNRFIELLLQCTHLK